MRRAACPGPRLTRALLPALAGLLAVAACQRPRPTASGAIGRQAVQSISLTAPGPGADLASPVAMGGRAHLRRGQGLVGMVYCGQGAQQRHCGNASVPVAADGSFAGEVGYSWSEGGPGVIEVAIIDPAQGVLIERQRRDVTLAPSP